MKAKHHPQTQNCGLNPPQNQSVIPPKQPANMNMDAFWNTSNKPKSG